jgi:carbon starvation protein
VTAVPLAWDAVVTLTASWQKVFSDNPKLGFFAQRDTFKEARDAGEVLPPAKNLDDMGQIVTNSTVDGVLAAFFAILIIVVIGDASRVWIKTIRSGRAAELTETPAQPSRLVAPSGLIATAAEREAIAAAAAGNGGNGAARVPTGVGGG